MDVVEGAPPEAVTYYVNEILYAAMILRFIFITRAFLLAHLSTPSKHRESRGFMAFPLMLDLYSNRVLTALQVQ